MICSNCQQWNPASATQCLRCQASLAAPEAPAVQPASFGYVAPPPQGVNPLDIPVETAALKPSGRVSRAGVAMLAGATIVAPLVLGWIFFQIIKAFPATEFGKIGILASFAIGAALGGAFALAVRYGKARNPILVACLAVLAAMLTLGTRIVIQGNQPNTRFIVAVDKAIGQAMQDHGSKEVLVLNSQPPSPIQAGADYVSWLSRGHIMRRSSSGPGRPITGFSFWFEFLYPAVGLFAAAVMGYKMASRRFCEACGLWYIEKKFAQGPVAVADVVASRLRLGDWSGVRAACAAKNTDTQSFCAVTLFQCPQCQQSWVVVAQNYRGRQSAVYEGMISPDCCNRMKSGLFIAPQPTGVMPPQ